MTTLKLKARSFPTRVPTVDPELIVERTQRELRESAYPAIRWLTCRFHDGRLVLQGEVGSFFLKQMAQAVAGRIAGAVPLENRVEVVD